MSTLSRAFPRISRASREPCSLPRDLCLLDELFQNLRRDGSSRNDSLLHRCVGLYDPGNYHDSLISLAFQPGGSDDDFKNEIT